MLSEKAANTHVIGKLGIQAYHQYGVGLRPGL
jgi:hypothetical protein